MNNSPSIAQRRDSVGDAAVDGLLAGVAAGVVMAAYLLVAGLLTGSDWRALLAQFDPGASASPLTGVLTHLAVSGVYGVVFGLVWRLLGGCVRARPGAVAGLLYGMALWLLASIVSMVSIRAGNANWLSAIAPLHLGIAHGLYGCTLGWLMARQHNRY